MTLCAQLAISLCAVQSVRKGSMNVHSGRKIVVADPEPSNFKGGESSGEEKDTMEKIEVDRKGELEAYIVRIMKMRKQLQHNQLVAELVEQVKKRFQPSPMAIKTRIEALIDKEYIKRSDHDNSCYIYLA